ncbi:MAG: hypothetical protein CMO63_03025 [Verrucomicrobiales bacterium]|nr:hypothetical protein [Verrucomicrobiales bacterium]
MKLNWLCALTSVLVFAAGCRVTFDTHYQKIGTENIHPNVAQYVLEFQITDVADPANPVRIATPKLMVISDSEGTVSIGELNKQFIEIKAIVSKETREGTAEISIIQNDRRASGKLTTSAGQPAEIRTNNFLITFNFNEAKTDR